MGEERWPFLISQKISGEFFQKLLGKLSTYSVYVIENKELTVKITRKQLRQIIKEELNRVVLNEKYDIDELPSFQYTVKAGDTPGELALMATGDASNTDAVNNGNPIKAGDVIELRFIREREGTIRKNPATGRTLEIPAFQDAFGQLDGMTYDEFKAAEEAIKARLEASCKDAPNFPLVPDRLDSEEAKAPYFRCDEAHRSYEREMRDLHRRYYRWDN